MCDRVGVLSPERDDLGPVKRDMAGRTNLAGIRGPLVNALQGADVLIGVSGGTIAPEAVASMAPNAIVFALANPVPEVHPDVAHAAGAAVVATGRSDFPNQINNVLAFPGIFRGALDAGATDITEHMKVAAATAIAQAVSPEELRPGFIIPSVFDTRVAELVATAVAEAAVVDGVIRGQH